MLSLLQTQPTWLVVANDYYVRFVTSDERLSPKTRGVSFAKRLWLLPLAVRFNRVEQYLNWVYKRHRITIDRMFGLDEHDVELAIMGLDVVLYGYVHQSEHPTEY